MTNYARALAASAVLFCACAHNAASEPPPPPEHRQTAAKPVADPGPKEISPRYPYLARALNELEVARKHLRAAEEAHAAHGTIGGHGAQAEHALIDAENDIEQAAKFAQDNDHGGAPGEVKDKPPVPPNSDDARYPNLGEARVETERAVRNLEDAEQFHSTIGKLGGHAKSAVDRCHEALREIGEAEKFADVHK